MKFVAVLCAVALFSVGVFASGWGPAKQAQDSGYIPVSDQQGNDGSIFYWFFESLEKPADAPLVLWLTGGPGCSSELAVFYEMGPYRFDKNGTVTLNQYAWSNKVNMLFVDQPIGTGFSYAESPSDYVVNEKQVAADMWNFMQGWLTKFPQFQDNEVYVFGESYAGHYVPAISWAIFENSKTASLPINLKGLAIGNGLVWPAQQYLEYAPFSRDNKLISESTFQQLNQTTGTCYKEIMSNSWLEQYTCQGIVSDITGNPPKFNLYNIEKPCLGPLCYDFSPLDNLMKQTSVLQSLGIDSAHSQWSECNGPVHQALTNDWFTNLEVNIPAMLASGLKVLVYSGQLDFICNWYGGRRWAENMPWAGQAEYNQKEFADWMVNGENAGTFKSSGNFTFLGVAAAGHMVPMDQPANALQMMETFIAGSSF